MNAIDCVNPEPFANWRIIKVYNLFLYFYETACAIAPSFLFAFSYEWTFNDGEFIPDGHDNAVTMLQGVGTLQFSDPGPQFQGFFKCFAMNSHGKAVANTVQLIQASKSGPPLELIASCSLFCEPRELGARTLPGSCPCCLLIYRFFVGEIVC